MESKNCLPFFFTVPALFFFLATTASYAQLLIKSKKKALEEISHIIR
jgi:hypothetical protein